MLLLSNISKRKITVEPLDSLETIATKYNTTPEKLVKLNNLKSTKVFVGMQLFVDESNEE